MRNPYLCLTIVAILGVGGLIGVGGIIGLAACGKPAPEALIAIISGAFGALSSFLVSPPRGSLGVGATAEPQPAAIDPLTAARMEALDRHTRANEDHLVHLREAVAGINRATLVVTPAAPANQGEKP